MNLPYDKSYLRSLYLQKRYLLTKDEFKSLNDALFINFTTVNFSNIKVLNIFLGITSKGEPDTYKLIKWIKSNYPNITITAPKINFYNYSLDSVILKDTNNLIVNKWGIYEPNTTEIISKELIDLMIVPLLCIDKYGFRIGYGKGFYDKFIKECRSDIQTLGLSLFEPINKIAKEEHDRKLTGCITPSKVIRF